ncbi:MAG: UDP-N-acetylmuramoyl-L-alanyl-D-glutamate--2,6-diaminopimelate ligase, partial [Anaerolineae bacterium]
SGSDAGGAVCDCPVAGIAADSRTVRPGDVFVAYGGVEMDGHAYIDRALAAGAAAVVAERPVSLSRPVPLVIVPNGRVAWARLCAAWEGHPSRRLRLAGVTGTDGKTTTAGLLHHILGAAGMRTGLVSTVCARIGERSIDTGLHTSTPTPPAVQAFLADMVDDGCTAAVVESTSEGLAQHRLAACDFDLAVLTNLTHDHLYYHGSFAAYREAKAILFRYLSTSWRKDGVPKVAVLNRDDASWEYFRGILADRHLSYGDGTGDVAFRVLEEGADRLLLHVDSPWGAVEVHLPAPGRYNAYNVAAALAGACAWGVDLRQAAEAVSEFRGIEGRMDFVRFGQPFAVVVDFAHTAYALESALKAARAWTKGRLIVVFGCAGERDRDKRAPMAQAAVRLADLAVFTAEDPRREDLGAILAQMTAAAEALGARAGHEYRVVPDRAEAIAAAVAAAREGDTVLLCGKGHERSMCFGREERPWSERGSAETALRALGYGPSEAGGGQAGR